MSWCTLQAPPPLPKLSQEEARHLKRVFDHMAGLTRRQQLTQTLERMTDRTMKLQVGKATGLREGRKATTSL